MRGYEPFRGPGPRMGGGTSSRAGGNDFHGTLPPPGLKSIARSFGRQNQLLSNFLSDKSSSQHVDSLFSELSKILISIRVFRDQGCLF